LFLCVCTYRPFSWVQQPAHPLCSTKHTNVYMYVFMIIHIHAYVYIHSHGSCIWIPLCWRQHYGRSRAAPQTQINLYHTRPYICIRHTQAHIPLNKNILEGGSCMCVYVCSVYIQSL